MLKNRNEKELLICNAGINFELFTDRMEYIPKQANYKDDEFICNQIENFHLKS